jgi:hypothetical protein
MLERPFNLASIAALFVLALVNPTAIHGKEQQISLQRPLWEQVSQLNCQELSRFVCSEVNLTCKLASGSAVWDVDFSGQTIYSHKLNSRTRILGLVHTYYDLLGTAINNAILSDGGLVEFYNFNTTDDLIAELRVLRTIADSVVVINFSCRGVEN